MPTLPAIDPTLTIVAPWACSKSAKAAWLHLNTPLRSVSITVSQSDSLKTSDSSRMITPAQLIKESRDPNSLRVLAITESIDARSRTSITLPMALPGPAASSATAVSIACISRPVTTTFQPSATSS